MTSKAQPLDFLGLISLSLMWSTSFLFIKIAVETIPPLSVAAGRMLIAAILVYGFMKLKGISLPRDSKSWAFFLVIGVVGNVIPFFLISWAELTIDSSVAAILIGVAPLVSFVIGHFATTDEKLTRLRFIGVLVGFAGVVGLIGPEALLELGVDVISQLAIITGACCYVMSSFVARKIPKMDGSQRAAGVLIVASLVSVPMALIVDQPWTLAPSADSLWAVLVLGIFPTAIATMMLFFLVLRVGATFVMLNNYLNPGLGVIWGYFFMQEIPVTETYLGLALIVCGLVLTQIDLSQLRLRRAGT